MKRLPACFATQLILALGVAAFLAVPGCSGIGGLFTPQARTPAVAPAAPVIASEPATASASQNLSLLPAAQTAKLPAPPAALTPATPSATSSPMPNIIQQIAQFVADVTSATPQNNPMATTPAAQIARPVAQIAASVAGPAGTSALNLVGLVASAIAGIGVTGAAASRVVATKNKTISQHKQAIHELAAAVPPATKLSPLTQTVVAQTTSGS